MMEETVHEQAIESTDIQPVAEQPEQPQPESELATAPQPAPRETEQARNFRAIKEAAARAARERDEALERLAQYESRGNAPAYQDEGQEVDIDLNLKDDDLAEGKHLQKLKTTIKKLEAKQKAFEQQSYATSAETRLRAQYGDFDKVMTLENIKTFSAAYPELAKSINASQDIYDKASSAYQLIKRFGIYEETPYEVEKVRASQNIVKPRPLTSVSAQNGDSPLNRANAFAHGLTTELKSQLIAEMDAAIRKS